MNGIITNINLKSEVSCNITFDLMQGDKVINITLSEDQAAELNKFLDTSLIHLEDFKSQVRSKLNGL